MKRKRFNTPILFITFNRLEEAFEVFQKIRGIRPTRLYISSDGARTEKEGEEDVVNKIRDLLRTNIDWECDVKTLFHSKNLGCRNAVRNAINWFFDNEEMGIILEDDCIPSNSFFYFCEDLLVKYKNDARIMSITGSNFQNEKRRSNYSYFFSQIAQVWGWASWRRAWILDRKLEINFNKIVNDPSFKKIVSNSIASKNWKEKTSSCLKTEIDSWDYPWAFAHLAYNGLCIVPQKNLVKNIGFGKNATHTNRIYRNLIVNSQEIDFPLNHPPFVKANLDADEYNYKKHYYWRRKIELLFIRPSLILPRSLKKKLKDLFFKS